MSLCCIDYTVKNSPSRFPDKGTAENEWQSINRTIWIILIWYYNYDYLIYFFRLIWVFCTHAYPICQSQFKTNAKSPIFFKNNWFWVLSSVKLLVSSSVSVNSSKFPSLFLQSIIQRDWTHEFRRFEQPKQNF